MHEDNIVGDYLQRLGPVLMAVSFDATQSYDVTLTGFGVALVCASVLVSRLGPYPFPARRVSVDRPQPA